MPGNDLPATVTSCWTRRASVVRLYPPRRALACEEEGSGVTGQAFVVDGSEED